MPRYPLINAKTEKEARLMTIALLRQHYLALAESYEGIASKRFLYCHSCDDFHPVNNFYSDERYKSGYYPQCRDSLMKEALDYDEKVGLYKDNREKTIEVFRKLDLPFNDSMYQKALMSIESGKMARATTAYSSLIKVIKSSQGLKNLKFKDSQMADGTPDVAMPRASQRLLNDAKKRFGSGYSIEDYMFLENEYEDWVARHECNSKSQEEVFERLAFKKWEIVKATKAGKPTDNLDKSFQSLLSTGNLTPKQDAAEDSSYTFGTLLKKYEDTKPLPKIDPELEDVDKIGFYYNVFLGHTSKMVGIKNAFSGIYEKFIKKYSVKRPQADEESDSEAIFDKIFGKSLDGD